jgi:hypothetical protein
VAVSVEFYQLEVSIVILTIQLIDFYYTLIKGGMPRVDSRQRPTVMPEAPEAAKLPEALPGKRTACLLRELANGKRFKTIYMTDIAILP